MHKISSKRQVTLPKHFCDQLDLEPGDFVEFFEHNGHLTVIKKEVGASKGITRHLKAKMDISDEESLQDAIANS